MCKGQITDIQNDVVNEDKANEIRVSILNVWKETGGKKDKIITELEAWEVRLKLYFHLQLLYSLNDERAWELPWLVSQHLLVQEFFIKWITEYKNTFGDFKTLVGKSLDKQPRRMLLWMLEILASKAKWMWDSGEKLTFVAGHQPKIPASCSTDVSTWPVNIPLFNNGPAASMHNLGGSEESAITPPAQQQQPEVQPAVQPVVPPAAQQQQQQQAGIGGYWGGNMYAWGIIPSYGWYGDNGSGYE